MVCLMAEKERKELKISVDFSSSFKFWIAFLVVQIILVIILLAVFIGVMGLLMQMWLPRIPTLTGLLTLAKSALGIPF